MTRARWYPRATRQELRPESTDEPIIIPRAIVLHRHGSPGSSSAVGRYFDEQTDTEAHLSFPRRGAPSQFMPFDRQADAQWDGNGYRLPGDPVLYGCVSAESEDDGVWEAEWTSEQVDEIVTWCRWMHGQWAIPMRLTEAWNDAGIGWHRRHPEWNRSGHYCVSDTQVAQIHDLILPAVQTEEYPMDALILIHPSLGVSDALAGLEGMLLRPEQKVAVACNVTVAKEATAAGVRVHAVGGPACDMIEGEHELRGATRLDTAEKVAAQARKGW